MYTRMCVRVSSREAAAPRRDHAFCQLHVRWGYRRANDLAREREREGTMEINVTHAGPAGRARELHFAPRALFLSASASAMVHAI